MQKILQLLCLGIYIGETKELGRVRFILYMYIIDIHIIHRGGETKEHGRVRWTGAVTPDTHRQNTSLH